MEPTTKMSSLGCHRAMKVLSHLPVWLSWEILLEGDNTSAERCGFSKISKLSAIVVDKRVFPDGEKNALLIDLELTCSAMCFGILVFVLLDRLSPNFRMSHIFIVQSRPADASKFPS
jgi:hypothetical protein